MSYGSAGVPLPLSSYNTHTHNTHTHTHTHHGGHGGHNNTHSITQPSQCSYTSESHMGLGVYHMKDVQVQAIQVPVPSTSILTEIKTEPPPYYSNTGSVGTPSTQELGIDSIEEHVIRKEGNHHEQVETLSEYAHQQAQQQAQQQVQQQQVQQQQHQLYPDVKLEVDSTEQCNSPQAIASPSTPAPAKAGAPRKHRNISERSSGERMYTCDQCGYSTPYSNNMKTHRYIHTGEKPFQCEYCDFRCSQSGYLKIHKRIHTGEKPYSCDLCDFRCSQSGYLKVHKRTHTGEKPYLCDICDFRCSQSGSLKVHKRTHSGDKPYTCDQCDFKCVQLGHLRVHKLTHAG